MTDRLIVRRGYMFIIKKKTTFLFCWICVYLFKYFREFLIITGNKNFTFKLKFSLIIEKI